MNLIIKEFIEESLKNQWQPSWPFPNDIYKSNWPWLPVDFDNNFQEMHQECLENDSMFVGHRQQDKHLSYNHEGWAALTLHGINASATENYEQYGFKSVQEANYRWTEACKQFPKCTAFIKSLNYQKYDRVRIMKLAPGGYIMPHVDGPGRIFGPLNIAINNPAECGFYFKQWGRVPFKQGTGFFLDIGNEHIVWNNSNETRYHFIVHGSSGSNLYNYAKKQLLKKYEPI
jgi:hypothetical protein